MKGRFLEGWTVEMAIADSACSNAALNLTMGTHRDSAALAACHCQPDPIATAQSTAAAAAIPSAAPATQPTDYSPRYLPAAKLGSAVASYVKASASILLLSMLLNIEICLTSAEVSFFFKNRMYLYSAPSP